MPGNKCGGNKVVRRSSGLDGLEVVAADEAICPNDSDICCSEDEIDRECSDYSPDGYKCVRNCFDLPQDEPNESEQLSNISPFLPKEAKCPKGQIISECPFEIGKCSLDLLKLCSIQQKNYN